MDICEGELNHGNYKSNVKEYAGFLIRNYIKDLSEEEEYLERRAYAILSLKDFPGKDTQALLKEQLKGKGPLGMIKPPRAIREAVNDVLAHLRGRG